MGCAIDTEVRTGNTPRGDHEGRSESGRAVGQTRGDIGGGGVLRRSWRCGHYDFALDEVRDAVAIGVDEHPAGGEGVCHMVRDGAADGAWKAKQRANINRSNGKQARDIRLLYNWSL